MGFKLEQINGTSPMDIKKLNDNLKYLWLKTFGNIEFGDLTQDTQKVINNKVDNDTFVEITNNKVDNVTYTQQINTINNSLETKVTSGDVHSIIQQTPTDIEIGFNGISNVIDIDANGIQVNHADGSYTRMEGTGFNKYIAGTKQNYRYLTSFEEFELDLTNSADRVKTIHLPNEYKNTNFQVCAFFSRIYGISGITEFETFVTNIDRTNGTFVLNTGVGDISGADSMIAYVICVAIA